MVNLEGTYCIEGKVHLLFVGDNGKKTFGITIRNLKPREEVEEHGYRRIWDMNSYCIKHGYLKHFGFTTEQQDFMLQSLKALEE